MKHQILKSSSFEYLHAAYTEWLQILGYTPQSVENMPSCVRAFFYFLEQNAVQNINQIKQKHYKAFYHDLNERSNLRRGGGLSNNYINHHIRALIKLHEFIAHRGSEIPPVNLRPLKIDRSDIPVLTIEEVKQFYEVTFQETTSFKQEAMSSRDRAMLTIFYGCGLRRNEGASLTLSDINFERRTVHVRKGKNYTQRFVPFSETGAKYLQEWIYNYRIEFVRGRKEDALFLQHSGRPMAKGGIYTRLKLLQLRIEDPDLQKKDMGLHTLRHSIATHLLQNGMALKNIQRFLGHKSLESTQIYTHLLEHTEHGTDL